MILGKRVHLRALERADHPRFQEWLNDPELAEGIALILPLSAADEEQWFDGVMEGIPEQ